MERHSKLPKIATVSTKDPARVSVNTSPAKRSTVIPAPASPAKSIAGAVMGGSRSTLHSPTTARPADAASRRGSHFDPPQRHPEHRYTPPKEEDEPQMSLDIFATPARSFFEPDSSDMESPGSAEPRRIETPSQYDNGERQEERLEDWTIKAPKVDEGWNFIVPQDSARSPKDQRSKGKDRTDDSYDIPAPADDAPVFDNAEINAAELFGTATFNDWNPPAPVQNPDIVSNQCTNAWSEPQPLASNPVLDTDRFLRANTSDFQLHAYAAPTTTKDRFLSTHLMTLQALLLEERSHETRNVTSSTSALPAAPFDFESSFGNYKKAPVPYSPIRPERPHSEVDSFIANPPHDESLRSNQTAPTPILKPPPAPSSPPSSRPNTLKPDRRSLSSPPSSNRRRSTMKHVSMAPPPIRLDEAVFKPPQAYTPFPFLKSEAETQTQSTSSRQGAQPIEPLRALPTELDPNYPLISQQPPDELGSKPRTLSFSHYRDPSTPPPTPPHKPDRRSNAHSIHDTPSTNTSPPTRQSTLRLFVRRRQAPNGRRTDTISISRSSSAASDLSAQNARTSSLSHRPDSAVDIAHTILEKGRPSTFDDTALFHALRKSYHGTLLGSSFLSRFWRRYLSARTLMRVRLVGYGYSPSQLEERTSGRVEEQEELVLEAELIAKFRKPKQGSGSHSWVHWAERVGDGRCGVGGLRLSRDLRGRQGIRHAREGSGEEGGEWGNGGEEARRGLEFVEGWWVAGIVAALGVMVVLAVAACLLWIFLGGVGGDWRDVVWVSQGRAQRVSGGCLIGGLVLLLGWTGVGGWLGVSWVIM